MEHIPPEYKAIPHLEDDPGNMLPPVLVAAIQLLGGISITMLAAGALIPAYHFGVEVQYNLEAPWSRVCVSSSCDDLTYAGYTYGLLLPAVIPIWMLSFSIIALLAKWLVIGKYKDAVFSRSSCMFLQWHWIDRLFDFWEVRKLACSRLLCKSV